MDTNDVRIVVIIALQLDCFINHKFQLITKNTKKIM